MSRPMINMITKAELFWLASLYDIVRWLVNVWRGWCYFITCTYDVVYRCCFLKSWASFKTVRDAGHGSGQHSFRSPSIRPQTVLATDGFRSDRPTCKTLYSQTECCVLIYSMKLAFMLKSVVLCSWIGAVGETPSLILFRYRPLKAAATWWWRHRRQMRILLAFVRATAARSSDPPIRASVFGTMSCHFMPA